MRLTEEIVVSEIKLTAEKRTEFGKGAARRIRRASKVPAVLYGHGTEPVHVALEGHATMLALKHSNALLSIDLEGTSQLALAKDVQRDPIRGFLEHVDLLIVRRGEKVTVDIPVHVVGEAGPGTVVMTEHQTLSVLVEATKIPESVEVDVTDAEAGTQVTAADVKLPEGAELVTDAETLVVNVTVPSTDAEAAEIEAADAEVAEEQAAEASEGDDAAADEAPASE